MTTPTIAAGTDIALKIPRSRYEATVAFYRDTLGFEVTEEDPSATPTVSRTHRLRFGPVTLWLDQVDSATRSDVWLQLVTDDLDATMGRLEAAGTRPVDELEPFTEDGPPAHWIQDPAGVVHLLLETAPPGR